MTSLAEPPYLPGRTKLPGAAALALLALISGACSAANGASSSTTRPPASTQPTTAGSQTTTTTRPPVTVQYVTLDGKRFRVPTERPGQPISSVKDVGQQVVVVKAGLFPKTLYAYRGKPIVWTNLTDHPVRIIFSHFPASKGSGEIPPGGTFSYTVRYNTVITYGTSTGLSGNVAVSILPTTGGE